MNLYLVSFANGWDSLQSAENEAEAIEKAKECYTAWFLDEPVSTKVVQRHLMKNVDKWVAIVDGAAYGFFASGHLAFEFIKKDFPVCYGQHNYQIQIFIEVK